MLPAGYRHSEETKAKIKKNNCKFWLGKKLSRKHKEKLKKAHLGKEFSEEHKKSISDSLKGHRSWSLGKKASEETRKKKSLAMRGRFTGVESHRWKGGVSTENEKARNNYKFREWRKAIFKKDNYTCQKYRIKGGLLHPHHIENFAEKPELRYGVNNGVTLSEVAHRDFHKRFGFKNNTKEQLEQFLHMKKILIIEDHYYFVRRLLDVLAPQHTTGESDLILITTTADPVVAEELLKKDWTEILIDHDLPNHWSGWQLLNNTSEYRKIDNAKIIAISSVPENNKRLVAHGADYRVDKMDSNFEEKIKEIITKKNDNSSK